MKTLKLRPGKDRSLLRRHPWIFESAIARGSADAGETVRVESDTGEFLSTRRELERGLFTRLGGPRPPLSILRNLTPRAPPFTSMRSLLPSINIGGHCCGHSWTAQQRQALKPREH